MGGEAKGIALSSNPGAADLLKPLVVLQSPL